jgi:hypothetical protein
MAATKKANKSRAPAEGSRRWYELQWRTVLSAGAEARKVLPKALAQISYENKKLRERADALEEAFCEMEERFYAALHTFAIGYNRIADVEAVRNARHNDGMVKIESTPHLRECLRVLAPGSEVCTCGSEPKQGQEKPN